MTETTQPGGSDRMDVTTSVRAWSETPIAARRCDDDEGPRYIVAIGGREDVGLYLRGDSAVRLRDALTAALGETPDVDTALNHLAGHNTRVAEIARTMLATRKGRFDLGIRAVEMLDLPPECEADRETVLAALRKLNGWVAA